MGQQPSAMHVARIRGRHVDRQGRRRDYESRYLRRTYRDGGKVKHETLANLSGLPEQAVDAIEAALKGTPLVPAGQAVTITSSLPHGHVAAVHAMAARLGLPALLGPAGRPRDLALALVVSRVVAPASKLSTLAWWDDVTLGADLGVAGASTDDIYAAMDWLEHRQDAIEAELARRHLAPEPNPARMALFDLSSSWLEGTSCPLAETRTRAVPGEGSPDTEVVFVGDRGMVKRTGKTALAAAGSTYITALTKPQIRKLLRQGVLRPEWLTPHVHEGPYGSVRLVLRRSEAVRRTAHRRRHDKLAHLHALMTARNALVRTAKRAQPAAGLRTLQAWVTRHKLAGWVQLSLQENNIIVTVDEAAQIEASRFDGCYV